MGGNCLCIHPSIRLFIRLAIAHTCFCVRVHLSTRRFILPCMCVRVYACTHARMHACMHACMHTGCIDSLDRKLVQLHQQQKQTTIMMLLGLMMMVMVLMVAVGDGRWHRQ